MRDVVRLFADDIIPSDIRNKLVVVVKLTQHIFVTPYYGFVDYVPNDPLCPRRFIVTINVNQPPQRLIKTLAHELTHVKQFATRQYVWQAKYIKWRSHKHHKIIAWNKTVDPLSYTLAHMPQEVDATYNENRMFALYKARNIVTLR